MKRLVSIFLLAAALAVAACNTGGAAQSPLATAPVVSPAATASPYGDASAAPTDGGASMEPGASATP